MYNTLIAIGSRKFTNEAYVSDVLDKLHGAHGFSRMHSGGAKGADTAAACWAEDRGVPMWTWPAQWVRLGRSAGFIRSAEMLASCDAGSTLVVAFVQGFLCDSRGTRFTVELARRLGFTVLIHETGSDNVPLFAGLQSSPQPQPKG